MSEVLLINRDDIMRITALKGNIDEDKILPHVKTAQDIHLQPVIGTRLLDKCKALIEADELDDPANEIYKQLVYVYITPALVFYTMADTLPFLQYEIANGGIFQHQSENSATPPVEEVDKLLQKFKDKGEFYGNRLTDWLCDNQSKIPELSGAGSDTDLPASGQATFHGWVV